MAFFDGLENALNKFERPCNAGVASRSDDAFKLDSSSLWKRRNVAKCTEANQARIPRRRCGVILVQGRPDHSSAGKNRTASLCRAKSLESADAITQARAGQLLRKKTLLLPQMAGILKISEVHHENKSTLPLVSTTSFPKVDQNLPEELQFIDQHSAPPSSMMRQVFLWPSHKKTSQGAEFYERSNGTTKHASPSSFHHQAGDGKEKNGRSPSTNAEKFHGRISTDGTTRTEEYTSCKWPRKPSHHLHPLDKRVFEEKSEIPKAVNSHGMETKRRGNRPSKTESSNQKCSDKRDQFSDKRRVPVKAQNEEKSFRRRQHLFSTPARFETENSGHLQPSSGSFSRCISQPDLSSMNYRAYWRVRRVGVCGGAEDTALKNDRTQARVLMKKFGKLNISE